MKKNNNKEPAPSETANTSAEVLSKDNQEATEEVSGAVTDAQLAEKKRTRKRSVLTFVAIVFIISIMISVISCWIVSIRGKTAEVSDESFDKVQTVAEIVNDFYSSGLLAAGNPRANPMPIYYPPLSEKRKTMLSALCKSFEFKYLYLFELDEENSNLIYLFVVSSDDELNKEIEEQRPYGTVVHLDEIPEAMIAASHGEIKNTFWEDDNEFGTTYGWACPVMVDKSDPEKRLVLGIEYDVERLDKEAFQSSIAISIPIVIILIINLVILLLIIRKKILKPIKAISTKMNSFADGGVISGERLNMKKNDEIGEIADSFDKMSDDIQLYLANINDLTIDKVQTQTQMKIAERIQYGIVPEKLVIREKGIDSYALEKPAKLIGGDFYDCFVRDDGRLCIVMGDVSGKGITAALFMVMTKTAIREKLSSGMSPAEVLNTANDEMCNSNPEGLFATVFLGVLDISTGILNYANAGHTPPVLISDKTEFLVPAPGIAIGLFEDAGIENETIVLKKGQGILLYTDGVTEAVDPDDNFYGEERLLKVLEGSENAEQAAEAVRNSVLSFYNGREQFDDLTVLSAFNAGAENAAHIKANLEEQDIINEAIISTIGMNKLSRMIILACEELFINIVSYSEADDVIFNCVKNNGTLDITFADNGREFDPMKNKQTEKPFEELDKGGMGISIMLQIARDIGYSRMGGYNVVKLSFTIPENDK